MCEPERRLAWPTHRVYRAVNRITPCDITTVLTREACKPLHRATPASRHSVEMLSSQALQPYTRTGTCDLDAHQALLADHPGTRCLAVRDGTTLLGYCWFSTGEIPASANTGGAVFRGIGLHTPPGTWYLYKAFVLPEWRNQQVLSTLVAQAIDRLEPGRRVGLVTTTDMTNIAFQRSLDRLGFVHRGWAMEWVVAGYHLFRAPRRIELAGTDAVEMRPSRTAWRRPRSARTD